jgi:hypothetical protein
MPWVGKGHATYIWDDLIFKNNTIKYRSLSPFLNKKSWIHGLFICLSEKKMKLAAPI